MIDLPLKEIAALVGNKNLLVKPEALAPYSHDAAPLLRMMPAAVARVRTAMQISALMKLATRLGFPVVPRGAGTGLSGGAVPVAGCLVLDMTPMNRILEIDPQNMTVWVEPGVVTGTLQSEVEACNLFYPPDPGSAADCTLGGNVAENAGGIRGLKYGVTRDYVLGVEVVLPQGDILRLGGKCVKDVAGYNLKDLLIGSEGTLAIFTRLLLRLVPKPQTSQVWLVSFRSLEKAGDAVAAVIESGVSPACLELMDNTTWQAVQRFHGLGAGDSPAAVLLLEVDGSEASVKAESSRMQKVLERSGAATQVRAKNHRDAERLKALRRSAYSALGALGCTAILEDATVPRSAVPLMVRRIQKIAARYEIVIGNFGHAGDGNLHPTCLVDTQDASARTRAQGAFEEIYSETLALGGTITGEHGVGLSKRDMLPRQWSPAGMDLLQGIKQAFDPRGILNPGKIFIARPHCERKVAP